jgi:thioredoxin reductase (NADPH)
MAQSIDQSRWDCVIVGAGPAGLTAAVYVARYLRRGLVLHDNQSRAALIPTSHNLPGYSGGISGVEFLADLRRQAESFGAIIERSAVTRLERASDGFTLGTSSRLISADRVILATGVQDISPDIPELGGLIFDGQVRYCPVCDGYEAADKRIAVIGPLEQAIKKADFLRTYSASVTVLSPQQPSAEQVNQLEESSVTLVVGRITGIERGGQLLLSLSDGQRLTFDILYPAMGCSVRSDLGRAVGAEVDHAGAYKVDAQQQTTVVGLYAIGDVVSCLDQIAVGTGHAAIAATALHNSLDRNRRR